MLGDLELERRKIEDLAAFDPGCRDALEAAAAVPAASLEAVFDNVVGIGAHLKRASLVSRLSAGLALRFALGRALRTIGAVLVRGGRLAAVATVLCQLGDLGLQGIDPRPQGDDQIGNGLGLLPGHLDQHVATGAFAFHDS